MTDWEIEPYQKEVDAVNCKYCNETTEYDFCSENCSRAYWLEMD